MNKTRLFFGIGSLVIAGILAILNLTLPPEKIWFDVGYGNWPWAPPLIFAITGIVLLAFTLGRADQPAPVPIVVDPAKAALNKRLETIAWAFFLIMLGGMALVPKEIMPKGVWSIGVGCIMLGLNVGRYVNKVKMSGFTTFLGILSVLGGIGELVGLTKLGDAMLLILLGLYLIGKPWFEKQKFFGKAEES